MKRFLTGSCIIFIFLLGIVPANALIMSGGDIIAAPDSVADDAPGAENTHQQAFNEAQDVLLTMDIAVDGGVLSAGLTVCSHMIFLNTAGNVYAADTQTWVFDGLIIGVMSNRYGTLEVASSALLGATGTDYTGAFNGRGMEGSDTYTVNGSSIDVSMYVTEPGDWIRVVTLSNTPVPEPSTIVLLGVGLAGLGFYSRKRGKK